ncbi:bacterial regulatory helix-turn-helix s, AraC family protein, partial [Vibrio harveyi]
NEPV